MVGEDSTVPSKVRALIVDDHPKVRATVRSIIESDPAFEVVAEAQDGEGGIEQAAACAPDVVFMDIHMPGLGGIEATRLIKSERPATRVVALSGYTQKEYVLEMLAAGAEGYVAKGDMGEELLAAATTVMAGGCYLCEAAIVALDVGPAGESEEDGIARMAAG